jgi:hypothetical protein
MKKYRVRSPNAPLKGVIACLRDLPTPAEAGASRRREPLRRRQGDAALQIAKNQRHSY